MQLLSLWVFVKLYIRCLSGAHAHNDHAQACDDPYLLVLKKLVVTRHVQFCARSVLAGIMKDYSCIRLFNISIVDIDNAIPPAAQNILRMRTGYAG